MKVELTEDDGTLVIRLQSGGQSELLQWAERVAGKYDAVFRRLAEN